MASESTFIRVNSATELAYGRNPDPHYFFGLELVQYPGSTAGSAVDNFGVALENTVTAQISVAVRSLAGAISGMAIITSFDAATTYEAVVNGTSYTDSGASAAAVLATIATAINAAHSADTDPSAAVINVIYNGLTVPALLVWAFGDPPMAAPSLTFDVGATSGTGTIAGFADPADITMSIWLKPKSILGAAFATPWCIPPSGKDITVEYNLTDRLDVSGYDRLAIQITNYTALPGMGGSILPLAHVWIAPSASEDV